MRCELASSRRGQDDGYSMVVVMGIISVLTVIAFGGFAMSMQAMREADVTRQESQGFQAANAGFDAAVARMRTSGFRPEDWANQMTMTAGQTGSGPATVTVTPDGGLSHLVTAVGMGKDGSTETIRARIFVMDLYGMNIAYGSGFNQSAGGRFNGNASVFGPFYTFDDLRQGDNLGNAMAGGFGWGPIYIRGGTLDVKAGYLMDVGRLYVDPMHPAPRVVGAGTTVIRSVPRMNVPRVDAAYLENAYAQAIAQSTDNIQGDPAVRGHVTNSEPNPYPRTRASGAQADRYKVVDNDRVMNRSRTTPFVIGGNTSFGQNLNDTIRDDFVWDHSQRILTVWGTVFIDGPLDFTGGPIRYRGNGTIVANGQVRFDDTQFVPDGGLLPGVVPTGQTLNNQTFRDDRVIGIATPDTILISGTQGNAKNPAGEPTHAGAFFADRSITINARVMMVGSVISQGIEISGNNNMDLRTSPNLGQVVSRAMPGHGMAVVSVSGWSRQ